MRTVGVIGGSGFLGVLGAGLLFADTATYVL